MSSDIPEYYRHLVTPSEDVKPSEPDESDQEEPKGMPIPSSTKKQQEPLRPSLENHYRANSFTLGLPNDWVDKTVFTLTGPVTDGIQHNITITRQVDVPVDNLLDFAEWQIRSLEETLKGCRLLLKEPVSMDAGYEAYRAVFVWWPMDDLRLYQEQVYVLHEKTGYTLTASFSKKTRKTLGPQIERAMLSFEPV